MRGHSDELDMPTAHTGRNTKKKKKVTSPHGRSEIEMMFDSRRGIRVKDSEKDRGKRRSPPDSKAPKRAKKKEVIEPIVTPFPLLTLPRVELWCRDPTCTWNKHANCLMRDGKGTTSSSGLDSSIYGRTMPLRYPPGPPYHHAYKGGSQQRISISSGSTIPRTSDSSGTDTSARSSRFLLPEARAREGAYRSRSCEKMPGSHSNTESLASSRSARAAKAATLEYSVTTGRPPKPSEIAVPGLAVRCAGIRKPQHAIVQPISNGRPVSMPRLVDLERGDEPEKLEPYNTFWHLNNLSNFQSSFKREASIHSCGGFTLNGQPTGSKAKKQGWTRFCSSHKIAFVVSTFSVLVTIGLVITLLLMKKKGMMEGMK